MKYWVKNCYWIVICLCNPAWALSVNDMKPNSVAHVEDGAVQVHDNAVIHEGAVRLYAPFNFQPWKVPLFQTAPVTATATVQVGSPTHAFIEAASNIQVGSKEHALVESQCNIQVGSKEHALVETAPINVNITLLNEKSAAILADAIREASQQVKQDVSAAKSEVKQWMWYFSVAAVVAGFAVVAGVTNHFYHKATKGLNPIGDVT